jgi:hypothetical protein
MFLCRNIHTLLAMALDVCRDMLFCYELSGCLRQIVMKVRVHVMAILPLIFDLFIVNVHYLYMYDHLCCVKYCFPFL